jgi:transcriptional regulator NrdR family protein
MEALTNISKKPDEKKPIEKVQEAVKKIDLDITEIKSIVEEIKKEFREFNENAKKGWFY